MIVWFNATPNPKKGTPVTDRDPGDENDFITPESLKVFQNRARELEGYGLDSVVAEAIAVSDTDIGWVRKAVKKGASAHELRRIFL